MKALAKMASREALKFVLFLGTVRESNHGSKAAKFLVNKLTKGGHSAHLLDPEVLGLPLLKKPIHFYKNPTEAPQILQDTLKLIEDADAFVVITAEYNCCIPPALTNMMDHFPIASYKWRPSGICSYSMGSFGGIRAAIQVRSLLGEFSSPISGSTLTIPQIQNVFNDDGELLPGDSGERVDKNADKLIKELSWYAEAIKAQKEKVGRPTL